LTASREIAVGMVFGAGACCGIPVLAVLLVGGVVIFRAAVTLSNNFLGASPSELLDPNDEELDEWIGYRQVQRKIQAIPEPGFGMGMLCVLLQSVVGFLSGLLMRLLFGVAPFDDDGFATDDMMLVSHVLGLVLSFPLSAWILTSVLPTTFGRACLVLLSNYIILIAIIVGVVVLFNVVF
jgi:hypothetical protein